MTCSSGAPNRGRGCAEGMMTTTDPSAEKGPASEVLSPSHGLPGTPSPGRTLSHPDCRHRRLGRADRHHHTGSQAGFCGAVADPVELCLQGGPSGGDWTLRHFLGRLVARLGGPDSGSPLAGLLGGLGLAVQHPDLGQSGGRYRRRRGSVPPPAPSSSGGYFLGNHRLPGDAGDPAQRRLQCGGARLHADGGGFQPDHRGGGRGYAMVRPCRVSGECLGGADLSTARSGGAGLGLCPVRADRGGHVRSVCLSQLVPGERIRSPYRTP